MVFMRFMIAVHAVILDRTGCRARKDSPSPICACQLAFSFVPGAALLADASGSDFLMSRRVIADTRNETASAVRVLAAPTALTRTAPRDGPATWATEPDIPSIV